MILILCTACHLALRVMPSSVSEDSVREVESLVGGRSSYWPDKFCCPRCDKPAHGYFEHEVDAKVLAVMELMDMTAKEAFLALEGAGIPSQQVVDITQVQELLREKPIRKVHGETIRGSRCAVIEYLELWDGTHVYLAASPQGAVAYRIRPPVSYTERALAEVSNGD